MSNARSASRMLGAALALTLSCCRGKIETPCNDAIIVGSYEVDVLQRTEHPSTPPSITCGDNLDFRLGDKVTFQAGEYLEMSECLTRRASLVTPFHDVVVLSETLPVLESYDLVLGETIKIGDTCEGGWDLFVTIGKPHGPLKNGADALLFRLFKPQTSLCAPRGPVKEGVWCGDAYKVTIREVAPP